ncbi:unnamed protein product, partial [Phaeothamnion confervicola]
MTTMRTCALRTRALNTAPQVRTLRELIFSNAPSLMGVVLASRLSSSRRRLSFSCCTATCELTFQKILVVAGVQALAQEKCVLHSLLLLARFFQLVVDVFDLGHQSRNTVIAQFSFQSAGGAALANVGVSMRRLHVMMLKQSSLRHIGDNKGSRREAIKPTQLRGGHEN